MGSRVLAFGFGVGARFCAHDSLEAVGKPWKSLSVVRSIQVYTY
jgi:hypothetical protein